MAGPRKRPGRALGQEPHRDVSGADPPKRPTRRTNSRRDIFISHDFRRQYRNCDQSSDARFQQVR